MSDQITDDCTFGTGSKLPRWEKRLTLAIITALLVYIASVATDLRTEVSVASTRMLNLVSKVDRHEKKLEHHDVRLNKHDSRLMRVETKMEGL